MSNSGAEDAPDPRPALALMSAGAARGAIEPLAQEFMRSRGRTVDLTFQTAGAIRGRIEAGEPADLVIVPAPVGETLHTAGALGPDPCRPLGRVGIGLAVRDGAAAPDVSTPEALRAVLLAAKSVAYTDPAAGGTGGTYFAGLLDRLGVAAAVRRKAVLAGGGHDVAQRVARGEAELGVTIVSEIIAVPGVRVGALLPTELQSYTTYVAAIPVRCRDRGGAERLFDAISQASARALWTAAGFEWLGPGCGPRVSD